MVRRSRLLVCMLFLCPPLPCPSLRNIHLVPVSCTCSFGFLTICSVAQSFPTLCGPKVCNPPGSSAHGIFQASILEWVAMSYSRDLPDPGIKPASLGSSALAGGFFITAPPQKPYYTASFHNFCTECFTHTFYLKLEFTKDTSFLVAH